MDWDLRRNFGFQSITFDRALNFGRSPSNAQSYGFQKDFIPYGFCEHDFSATTALQSDFICTFNQLLKNKKKFFFCIASQTSSLTYFSSDFIWSLLFAISFSSSLFIFVHSTSTFILLVNSDCCAFIWVFHFSTVKVVGDRGRISTVWNQLRYRCWMIVF